MLFDHMCCDASRDCHHIEPGPPFAVEWCTAAGREHLVAVADEEGIVTLLDASQPSGSQLGAARLDWRAHQNAIFDLAWMAGGTQLR